MKINSEKLLRHCWGDEVVDKTWGLHLGKTFREKEYIVIMKLLKKKVMEIEKINSKSKYLKQLTEYFRDIEHKGLMDMVTLQYLKEGKTYYNEDDGYPSSVIDNDKTKSSIMDCVEEEV